MICLGGKNEIDEICHSFFEVTYNYYVWSGYKGFQRGRKTFSIWALHLSILLFVMWLFVIGCVEYLLDTSLHGPVFVTLDEKAPSCLFVLLVLVCIVCSPSSQFNYHLFIYLFYLGLCSNVLNLSYTKGVTSNSVHSYMNDDHLAKRRGGALSCIMLWLTAIIWGQKGCI